MHTDLSPFDIVILGSGPAGLQAAIHAARRKVRVLVFGRVAKSSAQNAHITNFCCMDNTTAGNELLMHGRNQAQASGATFREEDVTGIEIGQEGLFIVEAESGTRYAAAAIILAMGISRNKLRVPGEKKLIGKGVSYCVDCDGFFFKDQSVVVVGNESAAAAGALTLLSIAAQVHLVYRTSAVNPALKDRIDAGPVKTYPGNWVKEITGNKTVDGVILENDEKIPCQGVFVELGAKGAVELAANLGVLLDTEQYPYIVVNRKQETNVPGIYAAGDICGPPWQVAKAVGEGCVAGLESAAYAKKRGLSVAK